LPELDCFLAGLIGTADCQEANYQNIFIHR